MTEKPYITVITSTFNAAKTLKRALDSVMNQSFTAIEHIIIDGGSTDGTQDIIKEYAERKDSRISYWISEPDNGVYDAWNKALPHINGDWVLFLGGDDYYVEDIFKDIVPELQKVPEDISLAYGNVVILDENNSTILVTGKKREKKYYGKMGLKCSMPHHQSICHRRKLFEFGRSFNTSFKIAGDFDFLYPILKKECPYYIDITFVYFSQGGLCSTLNGELNCKYEREEVFKKNGDSVPIIMFLDNIKVHMLIYCNKHGFIILPKLIAIVQKIYRHIFICHN